MTKVTNCRVLRYIEEADPMMPSKLLVPPVETITRLYSPVGTWYPNPRFGRHTSEPKLLEVTDDRLVDANGTEVVFYPNSEQFGWEISYVYYTDSEGLQEADLTQQLDSEIYPYWDGANYCFVTLSSQSMGCLYDEATDSIGTDFESHLFTLASEQQTQSPTRLI